METAIVIPIVFELKQGANGDIISKTEHALWEMSRCLLQVDGFDFSAKGDGRAQLYLMRERLQVHYGLYIGADHGIGLRFTRDPLIGMQWREAEFSAWAERSANELSRMWRVSIPSIGAVVMDDEVLEVSHARAVAIQKGRSAVHAFFLANLPPMAPSPSADLDVLSSNDVLRCLLRHGDVTEFLVDWSAGIARRAATVRVDRDWAVGWISNYVVARGSKQTKGRFVDIQPADTVAAAMAEAWHREYNTRRAAKAPQGSHPHHQVIARQ